MNHIPVTPRRRLADPVVAVPPSSSRRRVSSSPVSRAPRAGMVWEVIADLRFSDPDKCVESSLTSTVPSVIVAFSQSQHSVYLMGSCPDRSTFVSSSALVRSPLLLNEHL